MRQIILIGICLCMSACSYDAYHEYMSPAEMWGLIIAQYLLGVFLCLKWLLGNDEKYFMALIGSLVLGTVIWRLSTDYMYTCIFAAFQCFFTLPVYLIAKMTKPQTPNWFKLIALCILVIQFLIGWLLFEISRTDFSH